MAGIEQAESYTWHEMHAQAILPGRYSTWGALHKQWGCIVAFGLDIQKKGTCSSYSNCFQMTLKLAIPPVDALLYYYLPSIAQLVERWTVVVQSGYP